ncbi:MAG: hypothetical protein BJ554DRAFT_4625 [Olpidium bornovanus]|uniref:Uncharacterized protein n=1 Tax=Olpidium bornovanus TaxID=278681 RepID=A0A8H8DLT5_9FUNG|nr:MAG: hypothetical protein BJ554DRAFT_4625 [Olpidium bornovanus]
MARALAAGDASDDGVQDVPLSPPEHPTAPSSVRADQLPSMDPSNGARRSALPPLPLLPFSLLPPPRSRERADAVRRRCGRKAAEGGWVRTVC